MESKSRDSRPKPRPRLRTQKKFRSQGQGQTLSRPRTKDTGSSVFQKKGLQNFFSGGLKEKVFKFFQTKKVFKIFFQVISTGRKQKKGLRKFSARFQAFSNKISTAQKIVLFSSRGQGNFRGLERLRGQGQGLQNVS